MASVSEDEGDDHAMTTAATSTGNHIRLQALTVRSFEVSLQKGFERRKGQIPRDRFPHNLLATSLTCWQQVRNFSPTYR